MKISSLFGGSEPVFSFEFFPPKTDQGSESLYHTIERLRELRPSFVSVTYGAGGSTRDRTIDLVSRIKHELGIETMAHLTCVGANRDHIATVLDELRRRGIENILALRGDPPRDQPRFVPPERGFAFASELTAFIRSRGYAFCIGGACYPEGHVECRDMTRNLEHFQIKVAAGVDFAITQLFFDNNDYFRFVSRARECGIRVPIIPGIMPITNVAQIERFTQMCGSRIPDELKRRLDAVREYEESTLKVGVEHAIAQCRDLLARGAPGIHFYTLNKSPATRAILENIRG